MKKYEVIKSSREFDEIINNGKCRKNISFVVYYRDNNIGYNRYGISIGKKIGNAVMRNYYKRIMRNICDMNKKNYSNYKDYIIIIRKGCKELSFSEINDNYVDLIKKIN